MPSTFRACILAALLVLTAQASVAVATAETLELPEGFVRLVDVAPAIRQDLRYAGQHNFVGRPIDGYAAGVCLLSREAADALAAAADELAASGLGLRVYDCYRPARAVADFVRWARDLDDSTMQAEFYPRVDKSKLFELGYIAERSGHSRGSTVDIAIEPLGRDASVSAAQVWPLVDCASPDRFDDGVLDFGTGYDCFDVRAHHGAAGISAEAETNRSMLADLLGRHGFVPYPEEWWHYTLAREPFPQTYFDFPIIGP